MSYNNAKELAKWERWKKKEEKTLRQLGTDEELIQELYSYDRKMFNFDRRVKENEFCTNDEKLFVYDPSKQIDGNFSLDELLNYLENETLYAILEECDPLTYEIIELKLQGYNIKEISTILDLNLYYIYKKIKKFKNFVK